MKRKLSRRTFIASAAASVIPAAVGHAAARAGNVLSLVANESHDAAPAGAAYGARL